MTLYQVALLDRATEAKMPAHSRPRQPSVEDMLRAAARMRD